MISMGDTNRYCVTNSEFYRCKAYLNKKHTVRASVFIKLYRLGQLPGFDELLVRLHLESSSRFKEKQSSGTYTGIFDIANSERLGQSEVQLIDTMISGVGRLIELEKRLEQGETIDLNEVR